MNNTYQIMFQAWQ